MQMMTASDTWQAVACPSSTSRFVSRGGMSDYEITSADMLTKRTSEIRYNEVGPSFFKTSVMYSNAGTWRKTGLCENHLFLNNWPNSGI
jgi:hypothetical protein